MESKPYNAISLKPAKISYLNISVSLTVFTCSILYIDREDMKFFKSTLQFCKYFWDLIGNKVLNTSANFKYNR